MVHIVLLTLQSEGPRLDDLGGAGGGVQLGGVLVVVDVPAELVPAGAVLRVLIVRAVLVVQGVLAVRVLPVVLLELGEHRGHEALGAAQLVLLLVHHLAVHVRVAVAHVQPSTAVLARQHGAAAVEADGGVEPGLAGAREASEAELGLHAVLTLLQQSGRGQRGPTGRQLPVETTAHKI